MPKTPTITAKELIRALKTFGFSEHRQRGTSHLVMKHTDNRRVVIAVHSGKDIPKGTLLAILRDIRISKEELLDALK